MIEKIKNLKLSKPANFDDREWNEVLSRRNRLLTISDWTMGADSNLMPSNKMDWMIWRNELRNVTKSSHADKESARLAISEIEARRPEIAQKPTEHKFTKDFKLPNVTSLDAAKRDVLKLIDDINLDILTNSIGTTYISFDLLYRDAVDFLVERGTIEEYPVLLSFYNMTQSGESEQSFADNIIIKHKNLRKLAIALETNAIELRTSVEKCDTMENLKDLVDRIYGYRH